MIGFNLRQQAIHHATARGWSRESAKTVGELAVEVNESNFPIFNAAYFNQVMSEAMRLDGVGIGGEA